MKNITLIKISPCIQLGHMYEHLYCASLIDFLLTHGFFYHIDYTLDAYTIDRGVIIIEIFVYTEALLKNTDEIHALQPSISKETASAAWKQIQSEKGYALGCTSAYEIKRELASISNVPWEKFERFMLFDARAQTRRTAPLYISDTKLPRTKPLYVSLLLDKDFAKTQPALLPLFQQVARVVSLNAENKISTAIGVYFQAPAFNGSLRSPALKCTFLTDPNFTADNCDVIIPIVQAACKDLDEKEGFRRLTDQLRNLDNPREVDNIPDFREVYHVSRQVPGAEGWRKISTLSNILLLINNMTVAIAYGEHKISESLATSKYL